MRWNQSLVDGPVEVYLYGEPGKEGVRPVPGTLPGYCLNIAPHMLTDELAAYQVEPEGEE